MQKVFSKARSFVLVGVMVACNNGKNSDDSPQRKPAEPEKKPPRRKVCTTKSIDKILKDGRTIVSRSKSAESAIVLWDVFSQKVKKKIDYAFKYLEMSVDGEYLIRKISERRFQILNVINENINYNESLTFRRGVDPELKFSEDGHFVSSAYEFYRGRYKVNIFDVENRDFVYSGMIDDFKNILVYNLENIAILKSSYSQGNKIYFKNIRTGEERGLKTYSGRIKSSFITKNAVILQINNVLHAISVRNLDYLFSLRVSQVYTVDKDNETALVKLDNDKTVILDLNNGNLIQELNLGDQLDPNLCKLNSRSENLVCKDLNEVDKVKVYNFSTSEEKSVCI